MFLDGNPQAKTWALYELVRYWMPYIGGGWLILKAGYWIKERIDLLQSGVTEWGHKLLDNHLSHIQKYTEQTVTLLGEVRDNQITQAMKAEEARIEVKQVAEQLKIHEQDDKNVQEKLLSGIEVLKDRTKNLT